MLVVRVVGFVYVEYVDETGGGGGAEYVDVTTLLVVPMFPVKLASCPSHLSKQIPVV